MCPSPLVKDKSIKWHRQNIIYQVLATCVFFYPPSNLFCLLQCLSLCECLSSSKIVQWPHSGVFLQMIWCLKALNFICKWKIKQKYDKYEQSLYIVSFKSVSVECLFFQHVNFWPECEGFVFVSGGEVICIVGTLTSVFSCLTYQLLLLTSHSGNRLLSIINKKLPLIIFWILVWKQVVHNYCCCTQLSLAFLYWNTASSPVFRLEVLFL